MINCDYHPQPAAAPVADGHAHAEKGKVYGAVKQPAFYRPVAALQTAMYDLQAKYPHLVRIEDVGDTVQTTEGTAKRNILAMRITSPVNNGAPKPATLWLGSVHPKETANPELQMRWATKVAEGYGVDPNITAMLDRGETVIVPLVNVDGRAEIDEGYRTENTSLQARRTNLRQPRGVDLNRNFSHEWRPETAEDRLKNPSRNPGPSAASEPETQAIQQLIDRVRPTLFIDWHSPGKNILYPWGFTATPPPRIGEIKAVAAQFARLSGYEPKSAYDYSESRGTTEDYAYAAGALPFTMETGPTSRQTQRMFERSWKDVGPIMDFAASIVDAPAERAQGPRVRNVSLTEDRGLLARVSDATAGAEQIVAAEAFVDPATPAGSGVPLQAVDGAYDSISERVTASRDLIDAAPGALVQVRGRDASGNWGLATAAWVKD